VIEELNAILVAHELLRIEAAACPDDAEMSARPCRRGRYDAERQLFVGEGAIPDEIEIPNLAVAGVALDVLRTQRPSSRDERERETSNPERCAE
jgi:hypothetical protein